MSPPSSRYYSSNALPAADEWFHRPEDMALHKWGYKLSREFARRMPSYRGEVASDHPAFSEHSQFLAGARDGPVSVSAPDLECTEADERAIEEYIRGAVGTAWHSVRRSCRRAIGEADEGRGGGCGAAACAARDVRDEAARAGRCR